MLRERTNSRAPADADGPAGARLGRRRCTARSRRRSATRIRAGRLPPRHLAAARRASIAADLGVSRGVVVEAYQQLVAEGYLTSRTGGYTRVAIGPEHGRGAGAAASGRSHREIDFGYGRADVSKFPRAAWLRSVRRVLTEAPDERFGYLSGRGAPELQQALAAYLNRVRGTSARPENDRYLQRITPRASR